MAACCILPLVLASSISLAWLTGASLMMSGVAILVGMLAWQAMRKKFVCCNDRHAVSEARVMDDSSRPD